MEVGCVVGVFPSGYFEFFPLPIPVASVLAGECTERRRDDGPMPSAQIGAILSSSKHPKSDIRWPASRAFLPSHPRLYIWPACGARPWPVSPRHRLLSMCEHTDTPSARVLMTASVGCGLVHLGCCGRHTEDRESPRLPFAGLYSPHLGWERRSATVRSKSC